MSEPLKCYQMLGYITVIREPTGNAILLGPSPETVIRKSCSRAHDTAFLAGSPCDSNTRTTVRNSGRELAGLRCALAA